MGPEYLRNHFDRYKGNQLAPRQKDHRALNKSGNNKFFLAHDNLTAIHVFGKEIILQIAKRK
ncbi:MAG: hypothetical protein WCH21_11705, partial [Bacteroidota bacterium]